MKLRLSRPIALALFACPLAALDVAAMTLKVDPAESSVTFVGHATGHSFDGHLENWTLDLSIPDGADLPDKVEFKATIEALTTVHEKRDAEMDHWLETEKFPDLAFTLKEFTGTPEARVAVGELSLHGATQNVSIPVTLKREGAKLTVTGATKIDTTTFGLPVFKKFLVLTVQPEVDISFSVVGTLE